MTVDLNGKISIEELKDYLFPAHSETEHAVFLFATMKKDSFMAIDFKVLEETDFDVQSDYHIQVKPETIASLIKLAHDTRTSLIEIHSHVDQNKAKFSYSDWSGFEDFVPHVLWRLPDRPYAALVFTKETFDGLYWENDMIEPKSIEKIVDKKTIIHSTGLSSKTSGYYE